MAERKPKRRKKRKPTRFPLKEILKRLQLSQYELAKRTGIADTYVNALFHGRKEPLWGTVLRIATALELNLGDLWKPPQGGAA